MRRILALVSLAAAAVILSLVALAPQPASADTVKLHADIDRAQAFSTCPGAGPGVGYGVVTYDTAMNMMSWNITFSGMSGAPTVAHFHGPAAVGADAGIQVTIGDLTSPSIGSATITETQEGQLLGGLWYINYHTAMCGGGEIRGQVIQSVGGVAELSEAVASPLQQPDSSSGANAAFLAGVTAAAIAITGVVATGAWYARRRILS
jgi:hypothetical protein